MPVVACLRFVQLAFRILRSAKSRMPAIMFAGTLSATCYDANRGPHGVIRHPRLC